MILADTGALYALVSGADANHKAAAGWYRQAAGSEQLVLTQPLLTEAWLLIAGRLGAFYADAFWESVVSGTFSVIELGADDLGRALEIERKYEDAGLGFVDATSLAVCERYKISRVFTFDRTHFGIYRPSFVSHLELIPGGQA